MILLVIAPWPFCQPWLIWQFKGRSFLSKLNQPSESSLKSRWILKVLLLVALCIVLFLLCYFYPTMRQWQDESLGGKIVEHVAWLACFEWHVPKTGRTLDRIVWERSEKRKTSSFCRAFTLEFHVVISTGSMSQICCVVDSIGSTHSARKGFGYLRKKLAEEAKQAIRAAVSWTDAIGALRRDEGRHETNFHMNNRVWMAFCKQYFLYFKII